MGSVCTIATFIEGQFAVGLTVEALAVTFIAIVAYF